VRKFSCARMNQKSSFFFCNLLRFPVLITFVMEPFSPEDPVAKLLGKAKAVEPRPNFTQNVLRAVRQLPQQESGWERLKETFSRWLAPRPVLAGACAVMALCMVSVWVLKPAQNDNNHGNGGLVVNKTGSTPAVTTSSDSTSTEPDVVTELAQMDQFSQLLAQQDTKSLSDSDLAALLY